jgi:hypothetical protein
MHRGTFEVNIPRNPILGMRRDLGIQLRERK